MKLRTLLAVFLLIATVPAIFTVRDVSIDNRLERWIVADDKNARAYKSFKNTFGTDEFIIITITGKPLFEHETLLMMIDAVEVIEDLPGVVRVRGLPVSYRDLLGEEEPEVLEEEYTSTPFYQGLFLSADSSIAGIMIDVEPVDDANARRQLMSSIRNATRLMEETGFECRFVGATALIVALDELSESESLRSFVIALIASLIMLVWLFRSLRTMLVAAICAGLSVVLTLTIVVASGHSLNMITSVLPALLWVLSLSGAIHILRRFQFHRNELDVARAVEKATGETSRALILSAVTTAAGFISLVTAKMEPVQELGLFAASGILISLVVNLSVAPLLIRLFRLAPRLALATNIGEKCELARQKATFPSRQATLPSRQAKMMRLGIKRPRSILFASILLIIMLLAGIPRLIVASNPLGFLPTEHETVKDYEFVGENLTGFHTAEVVLELPGEWTKPSMWLPVDKLTQEIAAEDIVTRVFSGLDILRKLNQWKHELDPSFYRLPASGRQAIDFISYLDEAGDSTLDTLVSEDGRQLRLSVMVNEMDEGQFLALINNIEEFLRGLPEGWAGSVTGQVKQLVSAQQTLVSTQLQSLGFALMIVFALIGIGLGSWRFLALSILPNTLPIASAFGFMALSKIPLDAATVMVASVALGIAVDDTVHFLEAVRTEPDLESALDKVGPAMVITTLTACVGFGAVAFSAFEPIAHFGVLCCIAMIVALAADLLLVPAILSQPSR